MISKLYSIIGKAFTMENDEDEKKESPINHPNLITFPFKGNSILEEIVCIANRILVIPFPTKDKIQILSTFLNLKYKSNYAIYNVSEHTYDPTPFNNMVLDFSYPGYPCPPLHILFSIFKQIESWLDSDPEHIAVIHCQASKSRSVILAAGIMLYNQLGFFDPMEALNFYLNETGQNVKINIAPSQIRYLHYMGEIINGFIPVDNTIFLERIIINGVPNYKQKLGSQPLGCPKDIIFRPYIQIFKDAKLIFSSTENSEPQQIKELEGSCMFEIKIPINGDILIRCKHYQSEFNKISVFRIFFNTSFAKNNFIRMSKNALDIEEEDSNVISTNLFVDILFSQASPQQMIAQNNNTYWNLIGDIMKKKISRKGNSLNPNQLDNATNPSNKDSHNLFLIDSPNPTNEDKIDNRKNLSKETHIKNEAESKKNNSEKGLIIEQKSDVVSSLSKKEQKVIKAEEGTKEKITESNKGEEEEEDDEEGEDVDNYIANLEKEAK